MSWCDDKELLSGADVIGWNSLLKKIKKIKKLGKIAVTILQAISKRRNINC